MPPLRELGSDRLLLLEHFQNLYATQAESAPIWLSAEAQRCFNDYPFPGNVRELRNIAIRLTAKLGGRQIERHELESELDIDNQVPDTQPTASVVAVTGEPKRQRTPEDWINVARAEPKTAAHSTSTTAFANVNQLILRPHNALAAAI